MDACHETLVGAQPGVVSRCTWSLWGGMSSKASCGVTGFRAALEARALVPTAWVGETVRTGPSKVTDLSTLSVSFAPGL